MEGRDRRGGRETRDISTPAQLLPCSCGVAGVRVIDPHQKATGPDGDLMGGSLLMGSTAGDRSMERGNQFYFRLWLKVKRYPARALHSFIQSRSAGKSQRCETSPIGHRLEENAAGD
ncbi:unnamed protein product [Pleuronectes platessa]|uniref:Uncharacterized protein n=1 Tax=Pleuronectes platessa TaxID=8262 RepID=A0A9N7W3W2_PLEPL|nr:unnamed protein product [Pleuronectes platessa]